MTIEDSRIQPTTQILTFKQLARSNTSRNQRKGSENLLQNIDGGELFKPLITKINSIVQKTDIGKGCTKVSQ